MKENISESYILGISEFELKRLKFQHGVWKEVTDSFLDSINIQPGWKILDVGSGPGFTTMDLLGRVDSSGHVTALEPSKNYVDYLIQQCKQNNFRNYDTICNTVESANLPENHYDLIYARWVLLFAVDADVFIEKLASSLKPGGKIAFLDYAHEGLALYPKGGAFDNMPDLLRAFWRYGCKDTSVISAKVPKIFGEKNIRLTEFEPIILAGSPESGVFRWADKFFRFHIQSMVECGLVKQDIADDMLKDWIEHFDNPDSIFFSPPVIRIVGEKM